MEYRNSIGLLVLGCLPLLFVVFGCKESPVRSDDPYELGSSTAAVATTAVSADGTVYWAWFEQDEEATNVYAASLKPGSDQITQPIRVNHRIGDANMHAQAPAQVATGPNAEVYVVWTNRIDVAGRRFPASDLLFANSQDGGHTFSEAIAVNDDADGDPTGHTFHDVAVGPDGTIYVSWIDTRVLDAARPSEGQRQAGAVEDNMGHMHGHHGTITGQLPAPEIRVARSIDGGRSFAPGVVVDRTSCPCCRTSLTVGNDGTVYVAWRKVFEGEIRDMALAVSKDGGKTFSAGKRVHEDDWHFSGCPHTGPDMAVDSQGRLHIAWYTGAEDRAGLYYAWSDGGQFSEPITLVPDAPVSQVRMTSGPEGHVWLAWEDLRDGTVRLAHTVGDSLEVVAPKYAGNQPALAANRDVVSVTWASKEGLAASVVRPETTKLATID